MSQTETATSNKEKVSVCLAWMRAGLNKEYANVNAAMAEVVSKHALEVISMADAFDERDVEN